MATIGALIALFALLWLAMTPLLGVRYSPDSYGYALLGEGLVRHGHYASMAARDFYAPVQLPQPSRSFPPLWPLVVGVAAAFSGAGIHGGALANALVLLASLAAAWRLGRSLPRAGNPVGGAPGEARGRMPMRMIDGAWLFLGAFALFVSFDFEYRDELAAARAIPVTLLWLLLFFGSVRPWLRAAPLSRWAAASTGLWLALVTLTRFDQWLFTMLSLASMVARVRAVGARTAARELAWAWGTFALIWLPLALRNVVVFGTPLAADNSLSARSTFPGMYMLSYFAPEHMPATIKTAPRLWWAQRAGYLHENWRVGLDRGGELLAVVALLAAAAWRRATAADRLTAALMLACGGLIVLALSTTSYHDARYFSPLLLMLFLVGALALVRLTEAHAKARMVAAGLLWATVVVWAIPDAARAVLHPPGRVAGWPPTAPERLRYAAFAPRLVATTGTQAWVASAAAEEFSFYTRLPAMYLPVNVHTRGADFTAWLAQWHPDYVWADRGWVQAMQLEDWVLPGQPWPGAEGMLLLKTARPR